MTERGGGGHRGAPVRGTGRHEARCERHQQEQQRRPPHRHQKTSLEVRFDNDPFFHTISPADHRVLVAGVAVATRHWNVWL